MLSIWKKLNFPGLSRWPRKPAHIGQAYLRIAPHQNRKASETSENDIWRQELSLIDAREIRISFLMKAVATNAAKAPALLALTFRDSHGNELVGPFKGLGKSARYNAYKYVGAKGADGPIRADFTIQTPADAVWMRARLVRWGCESLDVIAPPVVTSDAADIDIGPQTLLAEIDVSVQQGEGYDVLLRPFGPIPSEHDVALLRLAFYDVGGQEVPADDVLPHSLGSGAYRLFEPASVAREKQPLFIASFTAPSRSTRMKAEIHRFGHEQDIGPVDVQVECLAEGAEYRVSGKFSAVNDRFITAQALVDIVPGAANEASYVEWLFEDCRGDRITTRASGLRHSDRCLNYSPLEIAASDARSMIARATFLAPLGTRQILWRVKADAMSVQGKASTVSISAGKPSPALALSNLAEEATFSIQLSKKQLHDVRAAIPLQGIWSQTLDGKVRLVGEAIVAAPSTWVTIEADFEIPATQGNSCLLITPMFLDKKLKLVTADREPGCSVVEQVGKVRHARPKRLGKDRAAIREHFMVPSGADFAVFNLFSPNPENRFRITRIEAYARCANDIVLDADTSGLSEIEIEEALQVAEALRDLPAMLTFAIAKSSFKKNEKLMESRLVTLADEIRELDTSWTPDLAPQPAYTPDEKTILHLFKVLYPDESSGGAVRSSSIVEAQAKNGLSPVAFMPLNSRARTDPLDTADGVIVKHANGVEINYPSFSAIDRRLVGRTDLLNLETSLANEVVRRKRVSLIHAASGFRGYDNALKGIALARANNLPLVYEVRSFHEHTWRPLNADHYASVVTQLRIAQENRCMAAADAVVTISRAMIANLHERGVESHRLFHAPNAIDEIFERLAPEDDWQFLRKAHNLQDKTTIGYISNFSEREGHLVLLDAFTRLVAQGHDLHLVLVGDGPQREKILKLVEARGLTPRVVAPGNVDHRDVVLWYHTIDLFVVPRIADFASDFVTPLKPLEAMAQMVPVIMSDRPVTAELAGQKQERASIFPAGDATALAALIISELSHPDQLQARALEARRWILAERTWTEVAKCYDEVYSFAREVHGARNARAA